MPSPVSIIRWFDAKTDPPTGDMRRSVLVHYHSRILDREVQGLWLAEAVGADRGFRAIRWAELPVVTDLTDEDLEDIKDMAEAWLYKVGASPDAMDRETVGRLRAALGGKEEA